jgi:hypothetical protein
MPQLILLDPYPVPEKGTFQLKIDYSVELNVTAEEARRTVKRWLVDEISYMLTATEPVLAVGKRACWRVPAMLTAPHVGHVGTAGVVDVDVETGEIQNVAACKKTIRQGIQALTRQMPPYVAHTELPDEWLAKERHPTSTAGRPAGHPLDLLPPP